ncbi:uncharacterized protein [Antennarius striatus]|uniref:uncharacterized protein n=1 Tax=Antennarius striatus TaxID=241820 RepID=UPI0035B240E2
MASRQSSPVLSAMMDKWKRKRDKSLARRDRDQQPVERLREQDGEEEDRETSEEKGQPVERGRMREKAETEEMHEEPASPPDIIYHGLYNQGATCYLNSVLQVLYTTTEMHDRLGEQNTDKELKDLFAMMRHTSCFTESITKSLGIRNIHQQDDAAQCLLKILREVNPKASEVFQGQLMYTTTCPKEHSVNNETNPFWTLPLGLGDARDASCSVENIFEASFQEKELAGSVYCHQCDKKTKSKMKCEMVASPRILTLHLQRFEFNKWKRSHVKSDCRVDVPFVLKTREKTYQLFGVVSHTGSVRAGHYTADVLSSEDHTWYRCDDRRVTKVEGQPIVQQTFSSRDAYLLMYRGEDIKENTSCTYSVERGRMREKAETEEMHEEPASPPDIIYHGLYNQGATCYLNSVLQVLYTTTEMHDRLGEQNTDKELKDLFAMMRHTSCFTESITKSLGIRNIHQQDDAAQCLLKILHEVNPKASEVFQGQLMYTTTCPKEHLINNGTNPFWTLPLGLGDARDASCSVENIFEAMFQEKELADSVYCHQCDENTQAKTKCEMVASPRILTLHLQRFEFNKWKRSHVKSDCRVDVPFVLKTREKTYQLFGVVSHTGSVRAGHYTADVLSSEDHTWYRCDDRRVTKVEGQPIVQQTFSSTTAYLLMYRGEDIKENSSCTNSVERGRMREKAETEEMHEEPASPPDIIYHGLYNQGATCYLNSVLQVLYTTTEMHDSLGEQNTDKELKDLFAMMRHTSCFTESITKSLGIRNIHQQDDAAQCLLKILHEVNPKASEVFQGQLMYTTTCPKEHSVNNETNPFWTLPLGLGDARDASCSVENIFEASFQEKELADSVYCHQCDKKTKSKMKCEMVASPRILTLHLQRFEFNKWKRSHVKSDCRVDVPFVLKTREKTYQLFGVVSHTGSVRAGHYTADVLSSEDHTWYRCDDRRVTKVEGQPIVQQTFSSTTAYLLMYRGEDIKENSSCTNSVERGRMREKAETEEMHEEPASPPDIIYHGLYNQGATCYLNSVLQVLYTTTEMHDRLGEQNTDKELKDLFAMMRHTSCFTESITKSLGIRNIHQQDDAAQCLLKILHEVNPKASEVFQGQLMYTTTCPKEHSVNNETNPFWTLPLGLGDTRDASCSVENIFEASFQEKELADSVYCHQCDENTQAKTKCEMVASPRILTLHLQRFEFNKWKRSHVKSDCRVDVPFVLKTREKTYQLFGVVSHTGSVRAGHYTADVLSSEDHTWYRCDDRRVTKVEGQPIVQQTFSSTTAYLLMYRGEDIKENSSCTYSVEGGRMREKAETEEMHEEPASPPDIIYHGLYNQGATCYLNSVLQVLYTTTEMHDRLGEQNTDKDLKDLFAMMRHTSCFTESITKSLGIRNIHQQDDAAQCLLKILHEVNPKASEVFQGQLMYTTTCPKEHSVNNETNPFWTLPLGLGDARDASCSVENIFEASFQEKELAGSVYCHQCDKKTKSKMKCEMVASPRILTLHLQRFEFNKWKRSHVKSDCRVDVPFVLKTREKTYQLFGVVSHTGSVRAGHYTADVLSSEDHTWYRCDDRRVTKVEGQPIVQQTFSSTTAYLLMYRGEDIKENTSCTNSVERGRMREKAETEEMHEEPASPPDIIYHGLYNQGATCYLNSVLQVLYTTTEMHDRLGEQNTDKELKDLFAKMRHTSCFTESITKSLGIRNIHQQDDAAQCLLKILHEVNPKASEVFQGQLMYTTTCPKEHLINNETNPFWTLPLGLGDARDASCSVENIFEASFQEKELAGSVYCHQCDKKTKSKMKCEMVASPRILTLHLQRFEFNKWKRSHVKSDCRVDVPFVLKTREKTYQLFGVVSHTGSVRAGHYTADVLSSEDHTWYRCDDRRVTKVEGQPIVQQTFSSRDAYLLMYRGEDIKENTSCTYSEFPMTSLKNPIETTILTLC